MASDVAIPSSITRELLRKWWVEEITEKEELQEQYDILSKNFDRVERENNRLKQLQGVQHV
jgi:hypothetical protein